MAKLLNPSTSRSSRLESEIVPRPSLKNGLLRFLYRSYPFTKGRWRLMKFLEHLLDLDELYIDDLYGRYKFFLNLKNGDLESSFYFFTPETYEHETQRYIKDHAKPGMLVFDVGAHYGLISILLADCVGTTGIVYSFEPEKNNFARLRNNIEVNDLIQVHPFQMALSNYSGKGKLGLYPVTTGHYLIENSDSILEKDRYQEIETITLDAFVDQRKISQINLLKIDAEGSGHLILEGAQKALSRDLISDVICEIHSTDKSKGLESKRVREILYGRGYRSYVLDSLLSGKKYLSELHPNEPVRGLQNLLFKK